MIRGSRLRQIGWAALLAVCIAGFAGLTFRVNAVKSEVRLAEREIIALRKEKMILETEFQTRANQQQLADWNRIEFGYQAPKADQYLENERELADLGLPRGLNAPNPIRVARAPTESESDNLPSLISPLTGAAFGAVTADEAGEGVLGDDLQGDGGVEPAEAPRQSLSDRLALGSQLGGSPLGGQLGEVSE